MPGGNFFLFVLAVKVEKILHDARCHEEDWQTGLPTAARARFRHYGPVLQEVCQPRATYVSCHFSIRFLCLRIINFLLNQILGVVEAVDAVKP